LYDLGEYPGAIVTPASKSLIRGEVFELPATPATLRALDEYEEFNYLNEDQSLFVRRRVRATLPDSRQVDCWIYVYNRDPGAAQLLADGIYSKTKAA
jgi:gamma-glutamylcyclotransferase (GGCT)/AIG2-like uncharacterized protein YtfP